MAIPESGPMFFAIFCGELAEKSDSVALSDCKYEGVLEMLRYMYGKEIHREWIDFLRESVNVENVLYVLS